MTISYKGKNPLLDLNPIFYSDALSSSNYTLSGSNLTQWNDLSGNGNNLVIAGSGTAVTYNATGINNGPAFQFSAGKYLTCSTGLPNATCTTFILHQPDIIPQTNSGILYGGTSADLALGFSTVPGSSYNYSMSAVWGGATTNNNTRCQYQAGTPEVLAFAQDGNTNYYTIYQDGVYTGAFVSGGGSRSAGWQIGAYNGGNKPYTGKIAAVCVVNGILAPNQLAYVSQWLMAQYAIKKYYMYFNGDSLTLGLYTTGQNSSYGNTACPNSYPAQFMRSISNKYIYGYNNGIGGIAIGPVTTSGTLTENLTSTTSNQTFPLASFQWPNPNASNVADSIYVLWAGTNDIIQNSRTVAATYADLITHVTDVAALNLFKKIVLMTSIPRASQASSDTLYTYNNDIRTGMQAGGALVLAGATHLCDLQNYAPFNTDTGYSNSTYYYSDNIHLIDAGQTIVAGALKTTLGW